MADDENQKRRDAANAQLYTFFRSVIKFGGASLVTHGYFTTNTELIVSGFILGFSGLVFSYMTHKAPPE